jgi:hypothetical protein
MSKYFPEHTKTRTSICGVYTSVLKVVKKPLSGACTPVHRNIGHSRLINRPIIFLYRLRYIVSANRLFSGIGSFLLVCTRMYLCITRMYSCGVLVTIAHCPQFSRLEGRGFAVNFDLQKTIFSEETLFLRYKCI